MQRRGVGAGKSSGGKGKKRRLRGISRPTVELSKLEVRELLVKLAPKATERSIDVALSIFVRAVENYREIHEGKPAVTAEPFNFKEFRRGLKRFRKRALLHALCDDPFSAFPEAARIKSATDFFYRLKLMNFDGLLGKSLDTDSFIRRAVLNDAAGLDDVHMKGIAGSILDSMLYRDESEEDLAGYVYLAISIGLGKKPAMTRVDDEAAMSTGGNYARLLMRAMAYAGAELPGDLRYLMIRGSKKAERLLSPMHGMGRAFSDLDILMSGSDPTKKFCPETHLLAI